MAALTPEDLDALVFDFDGVLTDNRVLVFDDGHEAVWCNRGDGLAFDFLRRAGLPAHILSREKNQVVAARAEKLGIPALSGIGNKADAIVKLCKERGFDPARVMFVGNDVNDLGAMRRVGFPVAVADAHPMVREAARIVLATNGGEGVVREIVESVIAFAEPFSQATDL
jgi:YrbI family 3-deoxy-D-manno-octulosonate 8-phosphate phosphatase